jgi:hypothetical protein
MAERPVEGNAEPRFFEAGRKQVAEKTSPPIFVPYGDNLGGQAREPWNERKSFMVFAYFN